LKKIPYKRVISGHIHLSQTVDNCTYVGSPRWLNAGDANQDKFIWLWNGQEKFEKIPTDSVVKRISRIEITEQNQGLELNLKDNVDYIFDISGSPLFVEEKSTLYKGKARIIPHISVNKDAVVTESMGLEKALEDFVLSKYKSEYGVDNKVLYEEIRKRFVND
jgi:DNA repair exonuclease SbcCD nuclease subunit